MLYQQVERRDNLKKSHTGVDDAGIFMPGTRKEGQDMGAVREKYRYHNPGEQIADPQ